MKIKWKEKRSFKPCVILQKFDELEIIKNGVQVTNTGFEYQNSMAALLNMLEFPKNSEDLNEEFIVSSAVVNIAKKGILDDKLVLDEINRLVKIELAKRDRKHFILTSVSLCKPFPTCSAIIEDSTIRILKNNFPKRFTGRNKRLEECKSEDKSPKDYAKMIITVKAKSNDGALSKAFKALDLQRAVWCLFSNSYNNFFGSDWNPINTIRLGHIHSVHNEKGLAEKDCLWSERNFKQTKPYKIRNFGDFNKKCKYVIKQMRKLKYKNTIIDALLLFIRALDEKDPNTSFIRLWCAFEKLTTNANESVYDKVISRSSFLFRQKEYHVQILEHLREYRNKNIHSGEQSHNAKTNCYILQFYFYEILMFHLDNVNEFSSLEEAFNFLDLPNNKESLKKRIRFIKKAIKYIQ